MLWGLLSDSSESASYGQAVKNHLGESEFSSGPGSSIEIQIVTLIFKLLSPERIKTSSDKKALLEDMYALNREF